MSYDSTILEGAHFRILAPTWCIASSCYLDLVMAVASIAAIVVSVPPSIQCPDTAKCVLTGDRKYTRLPAVNDVSGCERESRCEKETRKTY